MSVRHILEHKGREVATIDASATVQAAAELLGTRKIGALISVGESGGVIGILSERDIVRLVGTKGAEALALPVSAAMTSKVTTGSEDMTVDEAMRIMTEGRFRHLPVCEDQRLVGIISIGDVVKRRIEEVEREAENMRSYIHTG